MELVSPVFHNEQTVPVQYTCFGPNMNPPLEFRDVPANAQSLVLLVEDIDAPAKPWVHWLVFNIPPTIQRCPENALPEGGTEGLANGGTHGYEGPCPKYFRGTHHYLFRLLALDTVLNLLPTADRQAVLAAANGHLIAEAQLIGLANGTGEAVETTA